MLGADELTVLLERHSASLRGRFREEVQRDQFFLEVRSVIAGLPPEEPGISFELLEPLLAAGVHFGDWKVTYRPISSTLVFERVFSPDAIARHVELSNSSVNSELHSRLLQLDGFGFQRAVEEIFRHLPWIQEVKGSRLTRDGGVDFVASLRGEMPLEVVALGQVKRSKDATQPDAIREFVGTLVSSPLKPALGIFVSMSGFTDDAREACDRSPIRIHQYELEDVMTWLRTHHVGVTIRNLAVEVIDLNFWSELKDGRN
jgi:Restriction endonuclease